MGKAEPDGSLLNGPQGLVHQRRAVGPGPGGDAVFLGQGVADLPGIVIPDIQGNDGAAVHGAEIAVDGGTGDLPDLGIKCLHQRLFLLPDGGKACFLKVSHRGAQARDAVTVQGARFQCRGHLRRMLFEIGLHAAAAGEQGTDCDALPDIEPAGPLGPKEPLVYI